MIWGGKWDERGLGPSIYGKCVPLLVYMFLPEKLGPMPKSYRDSIGANENNLLIVPNRPAGP